MCAFIFVWITLAETKTGAVIRIIHMHVLGEN